MVNTVSAEIEERCKQTIGFAQTNLNHDMVRRDSDSIFDADLWKRCADHGVLRGPCRRAMAVAVIR